MRRRGLILGAVGSMLSSSVKAAGGCGPPTIMDPFCRFYVQTPQIVKQNCPLRCWAASAAMIFGMHNHSLDQDEIANRVFGSTACNAAGNSLTIASVLSSSWDDDNGDTFTSTINAAYDPANGIFNINNPFLINELARNRPLLYCNTHHAMVVSQIDFIKTPDGPNVRQLGVFDPWPSNPDFHPLTPMEIRPVHQGGEMTFLASVRVA